MPARSCGGSLGFVAAGASEGGGETLGPSFFLEEDFLDDDDFLEAVVAAGAGSGAGGGPWNMGAA